MTMLINVFQLQHQQPCPKPVNIINIYKRYTHESIYLYGVLGRFQNCTGHIIMGSWKGRGNHYMQFVRALYCKLPTNGKQLPAFPLEPVPGIETRPQRWEARVSKHSLTYFSCISTTIEHSLSCKKEA